ncbi:MAG: hypothetical protein AAFV93_19945 [Chloroflexota bacterium]
MTDDFYRQQDDFIDIFKFRRSTDEAVEQWAESLEALIAETPKAQPFYILLDVSGDEVTFSELARSQSKRIFSQYKKRKGYIAMVFEWRTSPYFARLFFATIGKLGFKLNYFTDDADACAWLREMHTKNK